MFVDLYVDGFVTIMSIPAVFLVVSNAMNFRLESSAATKYAPVAPMISTWESNTIIHQKLVFDHLIK